MKNLIKKFILGVTTVITLAFAITVYWPIGAQETIPALTLEEQTYAAVAKGRTDVDGGIINIAAARDGVITDVFVKEGSHVKKGDLLAKQDDRVTVFSLQEAIASEKQAKAQVPLREIERNAAARELHRLEPLLKIDAESKQNVDTARDKLKQAEQEIIASQANLEAAIARRETAKMELEQREIRAPLDGRIVRVNARPGVGASTLNVSTLFVLAPDTAPIVKAEVEESFVNNIREGQKVEILAENAPDKTYSGEVLQIGLVFGQKKANPEDQNERVDERVVEVITSRNDTPFLIGQRVLVRFLKNTNATPKNTETIHENTEATDEITESTDAP